MTRQVIVRITTDEQRHLVVAVDVSDELVREIVSANRIIKDKGWSSIILYFSNYAGNSFILDSGGSSEDLDDHLIHVEVEETDMRFSYENGGRTYLIDIDDFIDPNSKTRYFD